MSYSTITFASGTGFTLNLQKKYFEVNLKKTEFLNSIIVQFPQTTKTYRFFLAYDNNKFATAGVATATGTSFICSLSHSKEELSVITDGGSGSAFASASTNYIEFAATASGTNRCEIHFKKASASQARFLCNAVRIYVSSASTGTAFSVSEIKPTVVSLATDFIGENLYLSEGVSIRNTTSLSDVVMLDYRGLYCWSGASSATNYTKILSTGLEQYATKNTGSATYPIKLGYLGTSSGNAIYGLWAPRIFIGSDNFLTAPFQTDDDGNINLVTNDTGVGGELTFSKGTSGSGYAHAVTIECSSASDSLYISGGLHLQDPADSSKDAHIYCDLGALVVENAFGGTYGLKVTGGNIHGGAEISCSGSTGFIAEYGGMRTKNVYIFNNDVSAYVGTENLHLNYYGSGVGSAEYRNVNVYDGRQSLLASFQGSARGLYFYPSSSGVENITLVPSNSTYGSRPVLTLGNTTNANGGVINFTNYKLIGSNYTVDEYGLKLATKSAGNAAYNRLDITGNADVATVTVRNANLVVQGTSLFSDAVTMSSTAALQGAVTVSGALTASSTLLVKGALTASSTSALQGAVTISGALQASSTLTVTGAVVASSTLTVNGLSGNDAAYRGVVRIGDTSDAIDLWAMLAFPDSILAGDSSYNNYYLIGRGAQTSDRTLTIHVPVASDYGSGSQPRIVFASTGADTLASIQASTGNMYLKGSLAIGTSTSSEAALQVNGCIHSDISSDSVGFDSWANNNARYNFMGAGGYWGIRSDSAATINFDVYNSASPLSALQIAQSGGSFFRKHLVAGHAGTIFDGSHGLYAAARASFTVSAADAQYHGVLIGSTYNDAMYPNYGLVLVNGPNTSSFDVWGICHDGPAIASGGLHFKYLAGTGAGANVHVAPSVMMISKSGNVGIGTTSPSYTLHATSTGHTIYGASTGAGYAGVYGLNYAGYGVYGYSSSSSYAGIRGVNYVGDGVYGISSASLYGGVHGVNSHATGYGIYGENTGTGDGVIGVVGATDGKCIHGYSACATAYSGYFEGGKFYVSLSASTTGYFTVIGMPATSTVTGQQQLIIDTSTGAVHRYTSSIRYKQNVREFIVDDRYWDIKAVYYDSLGQTNQNNIGAIAEQINPLFPSIVSKDAQGLPDGLMYSQFGIMAVAATQMLKKKFEAEIAALKEQQKVDAEKFESALEAVLDELAKIKATIQEAA